VYNRFTIRAKQLSENHVKWVGNALYLSFVESNGFKAGAALEGGSGGPDPPSRDLGRLCDSPRSDDFFGSYPPPPETCGSYGVALVPANASDEK
jgi:hypothetical protein